MKKLILLVDDHPLIRKGIALTLEEDSGFEVCCQLSSAEEVLDQINDINPDAAIVDVSLPGMNGIELVKHIRNRNKTIKLLVVSRHDEDLYAERAIRAGANGYMMKQEAGESLVTGLRKIFNGGMYVSEAINARMLQNAMSNRGTVDQSPMELLSDRELEVFEHMGHGLSNRDIADRMHVSSKTIETYKARIKEKLGLESSHEVIRLAIQWIQDM